MHTVPMWSELRPNPLGDGNLLEPPMAWKGGRFDPDQSCPLEGYHRSNICSFWENSPKTEPCLRLQLVYNFRAISE